MSTEPSSLSLINELLDIFIHEKCVETEEEEAVETVLSQTLCTKSMIRVTSTSNTKQQFSAKNGESGITAKLRLTTKALQI